MSNTTPYRIRSHIAQIQAANFVEPVQKAFSSNPDFQLVQINLQDNLVKSWLVSLFTSGIKKQVPEALWSTYMISNQNMECVFRLSRCIVLC